MLPVRSVITPLVVAATLILSPFALAQQDTPSPAASGEQVEQLQNQLAEMKKEMDAMRKALEGAGDAPAPQRQMLQQRMGRMERYWQEMRDGCCRMHPHSHHCGHH